MLFIEGEAYASASGPQRRQAAILINKLSLKGSELVLDVGCGPGRIAVAMLRKHPGLKIHGIDISPEMIKVANRLRHDLGAQRLSFETVDLFQYEPPHLYDVTFSSSAMHWALPPSVAYQKLFGFTAPGGLLAVHQGGEGTYRNFHKAAMEVAEYFEVTANFENWSYPAFYPTADQLRALLGEVGFNEIVVEDEQKMVDEDDFDVEAFAYSGLLPYLDQVSDSQRGLFRQQFMRHALDTVPTVYEHRLYAIARRPM